MMELMERKGTKEEWKLPKNVRQIGEPGQGTRILIEDYAYTYLHQLAEENLTSARTAVLVGQVLSDSCIYVYGALHMEMGQEVRGWFSNDHWREIFQQVQTWFEGMEVVGWFLSNPGFPTVLTDELKNIHNRNFSGNHYIFMQMDILEKDEVVYLRGNAGLTPLCGYYIFYEKNEKMQAYMSQQKGGVGIEPEGILRDQATARFRNIMQEKKEKGTQKKTLAFLYTSCLFLVMVILVIGVTLVNNYNRMSSMESAIHQISESLDETQEVDPSDEEQMSEAVAEENQLALAEEQGIGGEESPEEMAQGETASTDGDDTAPDTPEATAEEEASPEETAPQEETASAESDPAEEPVQEVMSQAVREPETYVVQVGDTLLEICRARYGSENLVQKICEMNDLGDGNKIYVGQTIVLP